MWVVPCAITKGPPDEGGPGVSQEKRLHRGCGLWLPLGAPKLLELRRRKLGVRSDAELEARVLIDGWLKKHSAQKPNSN